MTNTPLTESAVIALAARLPHPAASRLIKGIGDDCAVIRTPGSGAMLLTVDSFIEGVHFLPDQPPESVGAKLLAVNLSDIASMGGRPGEAVIALMLPESTGIEWVERFYVGLGKFAKEFGVNVVGGDVSRHPDRITISLTLTGHCRREEVLYRKGAKAGDLLYVSGTLGDSDVGLMLLRGKEVRNQKSEFRTSIEKYLYPSPCVDLGRLLAKTHTASACIDLSDGIAVGARQLAEASGVGLEIDAAAIPLSDELKGYCEAKGIDPVDWALGAGGDYELLFTVPVDSVRRVERFGLTRPELPKLTCIGKVVAGSVGDVMVQRAGSRTALTGGWEHFGSRRDEK